MEGRYLMAKTKSRFYELNDDIGLAPAWIVCPKTGLEIPNERAGEPDPLNNIGINIPIPTQLPSGEIVDTTRRAPIEPGEQLDEVLRARIIPGTRIVETDHPAVGNVLLETGHYHEIDPPKSEQPRRPSTTTTTSPAGEEA